MAALTTPALVLTATGKTVTTAQVATAQAMIGLLTGLDLDAVPLPYSARDVRALTRAVTWQSPYVAANPNLAADLGDIASASSNGNSVTYKEGTPEARLLAPLARAALSRLSWKRSRSLRMVPAKPTPLRSQTLLIDGDDTDWRPLR